MIESGEPNKTPCQKALASERSGGIGTGREASGARSARILTRWQGIVVLVSPHGEPRNPALLMESSLSFHNLVGFRDELSVLRTAPDIVLPVSARRRARILCRFDATVQASNFLLRYKIRDCESARLHHRRFVWSGSSSGTEPGSFRNACSSSSCCRDVRRHGLQRQPKDSRDRYPNCFRRECSQDP
jgi:hypothetical protein